MFNHRCNEVGLAEAYKSPKGIHVDGTTMYVAGTRSVRDAWDDLKIPFRRTDKTERFPDADEVFRKGGIRKVAGHSLGGAVALEMQTKHPDLETETYGAPVFSNQKSGRPEASEAQRHCRWRDPVWAFDRGAKKTSIASPSVLRNHIYKGYA